MTNTEPKVYTIKFNGKNININVVKEMGDDDDFEDTDFRVYFYKLIETIKNQTDKQNFIEKLKEGTLRIFKIIVKNSDTQPLIRDMYYVKRDKWFFGTGCNKITEDNVDTCVKTPKSFYYFLAVNTEDIVKEPVVALTKPDVTTDVALTKPDVTTDVALTKPDVTTDVALTKPDDDDEEFEASLKALLPKGGNRRRRNNKKSKRKSKNNRKKTNRRR